MVRSIWFARVCFYLALVVLIAVAVTCFDQHYASAMLGVLPCFIVSLVPFAWVPQQGMGTKGNSALPMYLLVAGAIALAVDLAWPSTFDASLGVFLVGAAIQFRILEREVRLRSLASQRAA